MFRTLDGLKKIDNISIIRHPNPPEEGATNLFILIDEVENAVGFKIQEGSIKENGVNGCQVDSIIKVAKIMLEGLNKEFPCYENDEVIKNLEDSIRLLNKRKKRIRSEQVTNSEIKKED